MLLSRIWIVPLSKCRRDLAGGLFSCQPCRTAGIAQLVEQLICNQQVGGSSPLASSMGKISFVRGGSRVVKGIRL